MATILKEKLKEFIDYFTSDKFICSDCSSKKCEHAKIKYKEFNELRNEIYLIIKSQFGKLNDFLNKIRSSKIDHVNIYKEMAASKSKIEGMDIYQTFTTEEKELCILMTKSTATVNCAFSRGCTFCDVFYNELLIKYK